MTPPLGLDPRQYCPACRRQFEQRGVIGRCDHPFEGRPLRWWWANIRPPLPGRPVGDARIHVGVARCSTIGEAGQLLQPPPRHPVMPLDDPRVLAMAEGLEPNGAVVLLEIEAPIAWHRRVSSPYRS